MKKIEKIQEIYRFLKRELGREPMQQELECEYGEPFSNVVFSK